MRSGMSNEDPRTVKARGSSYRQGTLDCSKTVAQHRLGANMLRGNILTRVVMLHLHISAICSNPSLVLLLSAAFRGKDDYLMCDHIYQILDYSKYPYSAPNILDLIKCK